MFNTFKRWLSKWEYPECLDEQVLTENEWDFLKDLHKNYKRIYLANIKPELVKYFKEEASEELANISLDKDLFINSIKLEGFKDSQECELVYANRINDDVFHVYFVGFDVDFVVAT